LRASNSRGTMRKHRLQFGWGLGSSHNLTRWKRTPEFQSEPFLFFLRTCFTKKLGVMRRGKKLRYSFVGQSSFGSLGKRDPFDIFHDAQSLVQKGLVYREGIFSAFLRTLSE
jgi:hypothetical protein